MARMVNEIRSIKIVGRGWNLDLSVSAKDDEALSTIVDHLAEIARLWKRERIERSLAEMGLDA